MKDHIKGLLYWDKACVMYEQGTTMVFTVEVWCVSDLLEKTDPSGSSGAKAIHMKAKLFKPGGVSPDLVIAVGTAGTATEVPNSSGGVAVGGQVFLHNAHLPNTPDANPKSDWSDPRQETLISPSIGQGSPHSELFREYFFPTRKLLLTEPPNARVWVWMMSKIS